MRRRLRGRCASVVLILGLGVAACSRATLPLWGEESGSAPEGENAGGPAGTPDAGAPDHDPWPWESGRFLYVDDDDATCGGRAPCFATVQAAIDASSSGDTVLVLPGTYAGGEIIDTDVRIMSEAGPAQTVVQGRCFLVHEVTAWISGFTIRDCGPSTSFVEDGYGVYVGGWTYVRARIEGNTIERNSGRGGIGIGSSQVGFSADIEIVGNRILDNQGEEAGIYIDLPGPDPEQYGTITVENNIVARNSVGIRFFPPWTQDFGKLPSLGFRFVNNTITDNRMGVWAMADNVTLANNIVFGNVERDLGSGLAERNTRHVMNNLIGDGQFAGQDGNIAADPLFVDAHSDYRLLGTSPAIDRGDPGSAPATDIAGNARRASPDLGALESDGLGGDSEIQCGDRAVSRGTLAGPGGTRIGYETCDDGNTASGDGCSDLCQWEPGGLGPAPQVGLLGEQSPNLCVVRGDGSLRCWGDDVAAAPPGQYVSVAVGYYHACAIRADQTIVCWNEYGIAPWGPPGRFTQISGAYSTMCALRDDKDVVCWDYFDTTAVERPGPFLQVSAGNYRSCAVREAGEVECWGGSAVGPIPTGPFIRVEANHDGACALRPNGAMECWGMGFGPTLVAHPGAFLSLAVGATQSCALRPYGQMVCWSATGEIESSLDDVFIDIAPHGRACGLTADRRVRCWGDDRPDSPME